MTVHKPTPLHEGGNVYAAVPHQYFDSSGKTLIVTYTNHPNTIQAIKVVSTCRAFSTKVGFVLTALYEF